MYAYIIGKVDSFGDGFIVVEAGGIGYMVNVSNFTVAKFGKVGETIKLYLHLSVREDDMSLYGFYSLDEKQMFLRLITVSGVGPKMAIGILSSASLNTLAASIISGDSKSLSKVKGIGKKTAERIIVELKENFGDDGVRMAFGGDLSDGIPETDTMVEEALEVLMTLGVSRTEAYSMVVAARKSAKNVNELVMSVLQRLDK
ncbi:MAG: Holliday junction branch migration protein RuvA [Clostridia bacterium]|nr:Holliday junction branch migration protein RuvA [Clostridia bacterium]